MKAMAWKTLDLQAAPYKVIDQTGLFDSPLLDIISYELARSDNAVAVYRKYKSRNFSLRGEVKGSTEAQLEAAIDQLKLALVRQSGDLAFDWAGSTRYATAECPNVAIIRGPQDITRCGWSAPFFMAVPFTSDKVTRDFFTAVTGWTAGSLTIAVNNIGTYLASPYITLTLTGISPNVSDVSITIGNPATNESITITDEFANGDVITIDTINKQIFRGTELLAGKGNFPEWLPGVGLLSYSDTATTRTLSIAGTYQARSL